MDGVTKEAYIEVAYYGGLRWREPVFVSERKNAYSRITVLKLVILGHVIVDENGYVRKI